ncbi:MAG: type III-B CRISPR module RAMP protein Cmr1 [Acidobacteria bacterium]|nr:type III-B CRISPR module RAMP protein Cmr1 [Acidobacteriota bacterium]
MSRSTPTIAPPITDNLVVKKNDGIIKQVRRYKLITPLFGGGVEPGVNDDVTLISGKAIRGHLRFWWRATRGGRMEFEGDLKKMKDAEEIIWGAASTKDKPRPSLVQIEVDVTNKGSKEYPYDRSRKETGIPLYAAFPLQPTSNDRDSGAKAKFVSMEVAFTLTISFPQNYAKDIEAALWAWETFGGIGARTRRGFGAIQLENVNGQTIARPDKVATRNEISPMLNEQLKKYVVDGEWPDDVPHLSQDALFEVTDFEQDALHCWNNLIEKLKEFRQQRNPGRERRIPGRSKWSEPEAIREITKQRSPKHQKTEPNFVKFPRAAFGLPIVFQFKDQDKRNPSNPNADPGKTLLGLTNSERLASPLILRAIAVSRTQFVGVALILDGTLLADEMDLTLRNDEERNKNVVRTNLMADLDQKEAEQIKKMDNRTPLLGRTTDVLQAFLNFLNSKEKN